MNGEKVLMVDCACVGIADFQFIQSEDIKSIVTKEMMESIEYKVGG